MIKILNCETRELWKKGPLWQTHSSAADDHSWMRRQSAQTAAETLGAGLFVFVFFPLPKCSHPSLENVDYLSSTCCVDFNAGSNRCGAAAYAVCSPSEQNFAHQQ